MSFYISNETKKIYSRVHSPFNYGKREIPGRNFGTKKAPEFRTWSALIIQRWTICLWVEWKESKGDIFAHFSAFDLDAPSRGVNNRLRWGRDFRRNGAKPRPQAPMDQRMDGCWRIFPNQILNSPVNLNYFLDGYSEVLGRGSWNKRRNVSSFYKVIHKVIK